MSNPWNRTPLGYCRDVVRFALWVCLAINAAMLAVFTVFFSYEFLWHFWAYCKRVLFADPW